VLHFRITSVNLFKEDLKLDQMDVNVRCHLVRDFEEIFKLRKPMVASDESIIQLWYTRTIVMTY